MNFRKAVLLMAVLSLFLSQTGLKAGDVLKRADVEEKHTWNLKDMYENMDAWETHYQELNGRIDKLDQFKGHLTESPEKLYEALSFYSNFLKDLLKLSNYASRLGDQDLSISANQALNQKVSSLFTKSGEKTAYMTPELIEADPETIKGFIEKHDGLKKEFDSYLMDILRQKEHTLSFKEEKLLASAGEITGQPGELYSIFSYTEMPREQVTLSDGKEITLTGPNFVKYRSTSVKEDRELIFDKVFGNYGKFKNTYAINLVTNLKSHNFYAKARNYASCLERALDANNIPVSVYENLITQIHNSLPTLHRFLELKKKMLELDTLHYYDLYTPLVKKVNLEYTIPQAQEIITTSLKPMGKEYIETLNKAFDNRWIDFMPTENKRGGAYSSGSAYDVHPYILMNWNGDYDALSTLAHELGHTMHSYFSNTYQPFMKSHYSIFVAEIASTFNENLLNDYLYQKAKSKEEKLFLLGSYLEHLRTTVFRQTQFAEFEWEVHKMVEQGQPITGETLSKLYMDILKKYYGHDKGVCQVKDVNAYEWAYIPHFYYNFYVYQYSTSQIYSTAFAEKVMNNEKDAVKHYMKLLKGGCSVYPTDLIKEAGVDPLTSEAFELTMARMNKIMDEIEKLIK